MDVAHHETVGPQPFDVVYIDLELDAVSGAQKYRVAAVDENAVALRRGTGRQRWYVDRQALSYDAVAGIWRPT